MLCVLDGLSFPASQAGTKPVTMASLKEDKNAHGNARGAGRQGHTKQTLRFKSRGSAREEVVLLAQLLSRPS